eukprot:1628546-Alexandrium_andersonii.AAC.1
MAADAGGVEPSPPPMAGGSAGAQPAPPPMAGGGAGDERANYTPTYGAADEQWQWGRGSRWNWN